MIWYSYKHKYGVKLQPKPTKKFRNMSIKSASNLPTILPMLERRLSMGPKAVSGGEDDINLTRGRIIDEANRLNRNRQSFQRTSTLNGITAFLAYLNGPADNLPNLLVSSQDSRSQQLSSLYL